MIKFFRICLIIPNLTMKILVSIVILSYSYSSTAQNISYDKSFNFIINYKTIRPINIKNVTLYYGFTKKNVLNDSVISHINSGNKFNDTIHIANPSKFPLFLKIKIECTDFIRISNEFYYFPGQNTWEVFVNDLDIQVQSHNIRSFNNPNKLYIALVLLLQTLLEVLIAFMMSKMIGWSRTIMIMVLVANVATLPLYLIDISSTYSRELVVFGVKVFVMSLIGIRKIHIYKIIFFVIILSFISFGLKEILFIILRTI